MNTFYEFCYRTLYRKNPPAPSIKRPETPEQPYNTKKRIDCRNFACIQDTADVSTWKKVQYNKHLFYFCSEDCWNQWLREPATMGCWSPTFSPQESKKNVESFSLEN